MRKNQQSKPIATPLLSPKLGSLGRRPQHVYRASMATHVMLMSFGVLYSVWAKRTTARYTEPLRSNIVCVPSSCVSCLCHTAFMFAMRAERRVQQRAGGQVPQRSTSYTTGDGSLRFPSVSRFRAVGAYYSILLFIHDQQLTPVGVRYLVVAKRRKFQEFTNSGIVAHFRTLAEAGQSNYRRSLLTANTFFSSTVSKLSTGSTEKQFKNSEKN